ncbi:MAG: CoA transferase, partial [Solirubrobacteraceae bacterium]
AGKGRVSVQAGNELVRGERSGPLVLRCSDGFFGLYYRASDWDRVLSVFNDPALREPPFDTHPGRLQHPVELVAQLERTTLQRTQAELYEALQRMRVPAGPVMTADHLVRSQQFVAREFLVPLEVDGEHAVQPAVPVTFNGQRPGGEEVQR